MYKNCKYKCKKTFCFITTWAVDIIRTAYYIRGLELIKLIFAVLDVSLTMGLTRCYKTEGFFYIYLIHNSQCCVMLYCLSLVNAATLRVANFAFRQETCAIVYVSYTQLANINKTLKKFTVELTGKICCIIT